MTWRRWFGHEPRRSRALVVAGAVVSAAGAAALIWAAAGTSTWRFTAVTGAWLAVVLAVGVAALASSLGATTPAARRTRPARFVLTGNGFAVPARAAFGLSAMLNVMVAGLFLAMLVVGQWRRIAAGGPAGSTADTTYAGTTTALVVMAALSAAALSAATLSVAATVASAWRGHAMELTRAGLFLHGPLYRRLIPWQALAPGGPRRPPMDADRLRLAVARPDLVVQRGWPVGFGARHRPLVALQADVHPWFLADAIRWYAEHPADRAAIGTRTEHQRLVAELVPSLPAVPPGPAGPPEYEPGVPAGPPRPPAVAVAAWLTCAGVLVGALTATADLLIAIAFGDELLAAEQAAVAERVPGEPVGEVIMNAAESARAWAAGTLVLAVVFGTIALLSARLAVRGSDPARRTLVVLACLAVAWALCPCGPPTLGLTDTPAASALGGWVLALWLLERAAALSLGAAVAVLLLLPATNRYFRSSVAGAGPAAPGGSVG